LFDPVENDSDRQGLYDGFPKLAAPGLEGSIVTNSETYYIRSNLKWLMPEGEPQEEDWAEAVRDVVYGLGTNS
jgi:hypothetical protein